MKSRMRAPLLTGSLVVLGMSMAVALGGGLYEGVIVSPLWSMNPPASFSLIHPGEGVPLQTSPWANAHP